MPIGVFSPAVTEADTYAVASQLKAVADPARIQILSLLAGAGEMTVTDLVTELARHRPPLTQPTVSHHLAILERGGFLSRAKRGTFVYYTVAPTAFDELAEALAPPKMKTAKSKKTPS